jgi:hypothetical protein
MKNQSKEAKHEDQNDIQNGSLFVGGNLMKTYVAKHMVLAFIAVLFFNGSKPLLTYSESQPPEPVALPKWEKLEPIDVEKLSKTKISGILNSLIQKGINQIFCASYNLLAQELIKEFPSTQIIQGENQIETLVDTKISYEDVLAAENRFVRAGLINETELKQLDKDLLSRFPEAKPFSSDLEGGLLYSVVYFDKKLPWKVVFHGDLSIDFGADLKPVQAFGFSTFIPSSDAYQEMAKQVTIHYMDDQWKANEIVLSLHTESGTDEIIIGMVKPHKTLYETYEYVLKRMADSESEYKFDYNSRLYIPKVNFNVRDKIPRNEDEEIIVEVPDLGISGPLDGEMRVAMSLDERGATAFSRGYVVVKSEGISVIIDKPFLVAFRELGSDVPYIAAWIENTELLIPEKY